MNSKIKRLIGGFLFLGMVLTPATYADDFSAPPEMTEDMNTQALTYVGNIRPIFQARCAMCHNATSGASMPNWLDYNTAFAKRDRIYQRVVVQKSMPVGNMTHMTDQERAAVAEWIKDGAPQGMEMEMQMEDAAMAQLTFDRDILPIVKNRCQMCHNATSGASMPNWSDYNTAFAKRDKIYQRVVEKKDMPMGNMTRMTDQERQIFAQWINSGAPKSVE